MTGWNPEKVRVFREQFADFLNYWYIDSKDTGGDTVLGDNIYYAQQRFLEGVWGALGKDIHDIKCLKSRQLGMSTICKPLITFWMGIHDGLQGAMIFDSTPHREEARKDIENSLRLLENRHPEYRFPRIVKSNRDGLMLSNRSFLRFLAAGVKQSRGSGTLGRSSGLSLIWGSEMCAAPGTLIALDTGEIKKIEEIVPGDSVITHSGASAGVRAVIARRNTKRMVRISPFFGPPLVCTYDHKVMTTRGLVGADFLTKNDRLVMPIRPISHEIFESDLPSHMPHPKYGGAVALAAGQKIALTEEVGFAVGYYLAEGCLIYSKGPTGKYHYRSGVQFTRHVNEGFYGRRATSALGPYVGKVVTRKGNGSAVYDVVFGAALAGWLEDNFGSFRLGKKIPSKVFQYGERFCVGLLAGLLCGDASKTGLRRGRYVNNTVSLTSIHPEIAFQARDLAASLGFGWAGVQFRKGGIRGKRDCKDTWMITWSGHAAKKLRQAMGLSVIEIKKHKPSMYQINNNRIEVAIRRIELNCVGDEEDVYDLSLDHPDHTFRTIGITISNCSWENEEGIKSLRSSISHANPNRLYVWESTARGPNAWKDMWDEAKDDDLNQATVFIGWWARLDQRLKQGTQQFERYGLDPPNEEERRRIDLVEKMYGFHVDQEQLAWYRYFSDPSQDKESGDAPTKDDGYVQQDQPWTEDEAFILTGSSFFNHQKLTNLQNTTVSRQFQAYRFEPGIDFPRSGIVSARTYREIELRVWEEPQIEQTYIIGIDPAYGHSEKNDRSAIEVVKAYADGLDQVAEYISGSIQPDHLAWVVWALVGYYGARSGQPVNIICELNGPGEETWRTIQQTKLIVERGYLRNVAEERGIADIFRNARQYIFGRSDSMGSGHSYHWMTTPKLKVGLMEGLRGMVHSGDIVIRSAELLKEFTLITRDGDTIEAEGHGKDDRAVAMALCIRMWNDRLRRGLVSTNKTRAAVKARLGMARGDQMALYHQYALQQMFAVKSQARLAAMRQQHIGGRRY